jgi:hypothetical protein
MGKATLIIETYDDGVGTRILYEPVKINPYTVIGVLKRLIKDLEQQNTQSEFKVEQRRP